MNRGYANRQVPMRCWQCGLSKRIHLGALDVTSLLFLAWGSQHQPDMRQASLGWGQFWGHTVAEPPFSLLFTFAHR